MEVLQSFLEPFRGDGEMGQKGETRLIAVNEGRLVDFFEHHGEEFPRLKRLVEKGLTSGVAPEGILVVNLNIRGVTAGIGEDTLFDRLLTTMTKDQFWTPCFSCDLWERCYADAQ